MIVRIKDTGFSSLQRFAAYKELWHEKPLNPHLMPAAEAEVVLSREQAETLCNFLCRVLYKVELVKRPS